LEESVARYRQAGDRALLVIVLGLLGHVALHFGENERAGSLFEEALGIAREVGYHQGIAGCLESLARLWTAESHAERAVRLMAAAAGLRTAISIPMAPIWRTAHQLDVAATRAQLGEEAFAAAWAAGQALTLEQAAAEAVRALGTKAGLPPQNAE
jgi:hypothetical protein